MAGSLLLRYGGPVKRTKRPSRGNE